MVSQPNKLLFFEMLPMSEMQGLARQAATYVLNIATSHYESMVPLRYYTGDVVFAAELCLQTWYLARKKATFAESFYSCKRSRIRDGSIKSFTNVDVLISAFFEAILPFLRFKLE